MLRESTRDTLARMTAYGFDLDNTLTIPLEGGYALARSQMVQLANDLSDAGHLIHIITGGLSHDPPWDMESRVSLCKKIGVKYTTIERCIGINIDDIARIKGVTCNRLNIAVMIDDMPQFLNGVRSHSIGTVRLLIQP